MPQIPPPHILDLSPRAIRMRGTAWRGRTAWTGNHQSSVPAAKDGLEDVLLPSTPGFPFSPGCSPVLSALSRCPFPLPGLCQDQCKAWSLLLCFAASQHLVPECGAGWEQPLSRATSDTSLIPVTRGGWLCAAEAAEDSGVMHRAQVPCFGFAPVVTGRAVGTSPPCAWLPRERRLEGVETTGDAADKVLAEVFCGDLGNPQGRGHSVSPSAPAQQLPDWGGPCRGIPSTPCPGPTAQFLQAGGKAGDT